MADPVVTLDDVRFEFSDGTQALKGVTLDVFPRELLLLFGPSRSGKTTLLRLLNRLTDLNEGSRHDGRVAYHGQDIFGSRVDVTWLRRRIAMVFAIPTPLPGTILQNMSYGLRMAGERDQASIDRKVETALRQAALWDEVRDRLHQSAFALSGGQKQRLCLARSLVMEPEVILLDNPTSGLDPISTAVVEQSLLELKQRYTIVMVPHSVQQAARLADRAGFMLDGELVEVGPGADMFIQPKHERTEAYITGRFG